MINKPFNYNVQNSKLQNLIYKIKAKELNIENLTDVEKQEVYMFLKNEIIEKKIKLKKNKNLILYNKIKSNNNILNKISKEDKKNFIEYCKNKKFNA